MARATRSYVAGEVENVSRLTVDPIDRVRAKRFVVREHYSGTFSGRVSVGLFAIRLVGVAVFAEQRRRTILAAPGARLGHPSRFVLLEARRERGDVVLARARALRRELAGVAPSSPTRTRSSDAPRTGPSSCPVT